MISTKGTKVSGHNGRACATTTMMPKVAIMTEGNESFSHAEWLNSDISAATKDFLDADYDVCLIF